MNRQKGFTLVELLVVITVIGILVALAVPNVTKLKIKAKETRVMGGAHEIQSALETFASSHDGLYPGLAVPAADNVAPHTDPFVNNAPNFKTMRAIIGGGPVKPEDPNLDFLDAFYFIPNPNDVNCPLQVPDRLVADGAGISVYPENPFRPSMTNVTDQAIPMINIFGIEFTAFPDPSKQDIFATDPASVRLCEPLWFGQDNSSKTIESPGAYWFAAPATNDVRYRGDYLSSANNGNFLKYDPNQDYKVERADLQSTGFPEGNFAYIPLDPVQTDPTAVDFLRYSRHYWLVIYGSTDTALQNKYKDVLPSFPRPLGTGIQHTDPLDFQGGGSNPATAYEKTVKMALVGAMQVIPTNYKEQLKLEGS